MVFLQLQGSMAKKKKKKGEMAEDLCRAEILSGRGGSGICLCIGCFAVTFAERSMG